MEIVNINSVLFEELLENIFLLLRPPDLKSAVLVCKSWKKVGEMSKLWAWVRLVVTGANLSMMPQFLGTERCKAIQKLAVKAVSEELFLAIEAHSGIEVLEVSRTDDLSKGDLSSLEPALLVRVLFKMEEVKFINFTTHFSTFLTPQQMQAIFEAAVSSPKLKKLSLVGAMWTSVDPNTIARVASEVEELHITRNTGLDRHQTQAIFEAASTSTKLKKLSIWGFLNSVDPNTIARVAFQVEELHITGGLGLNRHQTQAIFEAASTSPNLKKLSHAGSITSVDPNTIARVASQLEEFYITGITGLNRQRIRPRPF